MDSNIKELRSNLFVLIKQFDKMESYVNNQLVNKIEFEVLN